jgi:hypothetical protein
MNDMEPQSVVVFLQSIQRILMFPQQQCWHLQFTDKVAQYTQGQSYDATDNASITASTYISGAGIEEGIMTMLYSFFCSIRQEVMILGILNASSARLPNLSPQYWPLQQVAQPRSDDYRSDKPSEGGSYPAVIE